MSELFEQLPEVGDPEKPRIAFFFDEAHLLFDDAPRALVNKVEQVARLIRSKGVSIWFITQSPSDVPEDILGQLGNRVQHALRAFTPKDQKALRLAAETYRANPAFDTALAIQQVGTGEAVTSFLGQKGAPGVVERTLIRPPFSKLGPISDTERSEITKRSEMGPKYDTAIDRETAHEILTERAMIAAQDSAAGGNRDSETDLWAMDQEYNRARRYDPDLEIKATKARTSRRSSRNDTLIETFGKSMARQLGTKSGQALVRGVLGSLFRGR